MTIQVDIREATGDDAATLSAIGHASFRKAYEEWSHPDDLVAHLEAFFSEEAIEKEMQLPGHSYLIALIDDVATGFVKIREAARPAEVPATRALELHQVYVMPEWQRHGVGGMLIDAAAEYAAERAADGIWLSVWRDAPWAVNCYRKHGFEEVGTTEFMLGRTVYNDLLMWRPT